MQNIKDGASWVSGTKLDRAADRVDGEHKTALEYAKNLRDPETKDLQGVQRPRDAQIVVAGITYVDKSKYRSGVCMQLRFSLSISSSAYS